MPEELGIPDQPNIIADVVTHPITKGLGEKSIDAVFSKAIKTVTGQNGYEKDKAEADFKMLAQQNMMSEAAMTSVPAGQDQQNIRGNYVFHTAGNRTMLIDGKETLVVKGTQTHTVDELASLLYNATRKVVVADDDTLTVHGEQQVFVVGESSHQFLGKHEVTAPDEFEWKTFERGFSAYKLDMAVTDFDIHGLGIDTHALDVELALFKGQGGALEEVLKGQEGKADALQLEVSIEIDIKGRGDVLIDIGIGTPFR